MCTLIPTRFEFPGARAPKARRVAIVGSFNSWDATAHPLTKMPGGDWAITVYFPAGRIVYGFDVDGVLRPDPFDEARMPNGRGSTYSIRSVRPNPDPSHNRVAANVHASRTNTASTQAAQTRRRRRTIRPRGGKLAARWGVPKRTPDGIDAGSRGWVSQ